MRFFTLLLSAFLYFACESPTKQTQRSISLDTLVNDSLIIEEGIPLPIYCDTILDRLARFVAGLPQLDSSQYRIMEDAEHWMDYNLFMDANWYRMEESRLNQMSSWKDEYLLPSIHDSLAVFYPFGGPDLLHAVVLYSNSSEFILAGLEPITEIPNIAGFTSQEQNAYLDSLSSSLRDIFGKSFFITRNMKNDLQQVSGVVPLFLVFIARTGHEMVGMNYISIDSAGNDHEVSFDELVMSRVKAVRFEFRNRGGGHLKRMYYLSGDVSNPGLRSKKEFNAFLNRKKPFNTFIKSASYLMHQEYFSLIRGLIIESSESILQDDTGIPYRFLKGDDYKGYFFGEYQRPVKTFFYLEKQEDLDSAFQIKSNPLPFSLGYHWGDRKQHYMFFKKKNSIFVP